MEIKRSANIETKTETKAESNLGLNTRTVEINTETNMELIQGQKKLKKGHTTGSCAAAASKAALQTILTGKEVSIIVIDTPKGVRLNLQVHKLGIDADCNLRESKLWISDSKNVKSYECSVIKDAGDDPDVTHGLNISSRVTVSYGGEEPEMERDHHPYEYVIRARGKDIFVNITGRSGVGVVTKKGLSCDVGKSAINPVPRSMIIKELGSLLKEEGLELYPDRIWVEISVENGQQTALKTFNPKLGIIGGISILGTSGIVEPMSEKALVDTIKTEMNQFVTLNMADGKASETVKPMLVCPGNYGLDFAREVLELDLEKGVKSSNYIGEVLDYACYLKIPNILLVGHGGKLIKLAAGVMNTHSAMADGRQEVIASHSAIKGADIPTLEAIMEAISIEETVDIMKAYEATEDEKSGKAQNFCSRTFDSIEKKIRGHIDHRTKNQVGVEYIVFTKAHGILIESDGAREMMSQLKE
ncbi:MAG: cobalt-precorrin-5B (C(1))-methyltransferase CbiD [Proteocatella sp.]